MYNFLHKYKSSILTLLKIVIVLGAFYFIYKKLVFDNQLSLNELKQQLAVLFSNNIWKLLALLLFTDLNWLLEINKWKKLVSVEKKINFFNAFEQCLASHTASIITPNRIGEYGAKALFFEKEERKKIVFLNLVGNLFQLISTLIFGFVGALFIITNYTLKTPEFTLKNKEFIVLIILIICFGILLLVFKKWISKSIFKTLNYLKNISNQILFEVGLLSLLRYITFSHQFYFLLLLFQIEIDYFTGMSLIFSMYLFASIIPALSLFDWAIKGSIAVLLFSITAVNPLTIISITTIMWILNFAIPALLGIGFVLNFKLPKQ